jgi:hypothetical protein
MIANHLPAQSHHQAVEKDISSTPTTITSSTGMSGARIVGAILTSAAESLIYGAGSSKSAFAARDELRSLRAASQQVPRSFTAHNNLLRILEESKPSLPSLDHSNCCENDANFSCYHSGTCSACSESTSSTANSSEHEESRKNNDIPGFGWAKKAKLKSNARINKAEAKKEKSAAGLKHFVYGLTIMDFFDMQKKGCNDQCIHGRECLKKVNIEFIGRLRENFWGKRKDNPLKPDARKIKIQNIFTTAMALQSGKVSRLSIKYY